MIVYSKKIVQFLNDIKSTIKLILATEAQLKVTSHNRFYDRMQRTSYPIRVVIYNNKKMLGYFDPDFYEMGFHECLMHVNKDQLHDVIRHELAHYLTFINHGIVNNPHGNEFRELCQRLGWGENVYSATVCLESQNVIENQESNTLRKIQKLLALATSNNENEAEQAMIKSQQLLLKHNLESTYIDSKDEEKVFLKRILKQKRENAKMRSIARILETFFVSTVYARGEECIYLELLGNAVNIEIAEHVATFLESELERLWKQVQRHTHLKGMIAKNSFFLGLAKGYCNKIEALKREYSSDVSHALMVIEKQLVDAKAMAYERLSSKCSNGRYCSHSSSLGELMGKQLNINPAINKSPTASGKFIGYSQN